MNDSKFVLAGRYAVGRLLGHGGMAEVHLAEDTRLHRTVAVKILRSDLARDDTFQERFRREAQSAGGLNHPSIVSVYDTGEDTVTDGNGNQSTIPYIIMEYVEGHTLREDINAENPMGADQAVRILGSLLSALEFSHKAGIVHRDIKPGNVMITTTGAVKVMDFGIARAVADAASAMTQTQAVMGTAQYLSPEQARGQLVDARTDIYSSACVLYELLTGRPPFTGDSPVSIAYQHVREEPEPPSTYNPAITPQMDQVILTALAKDREQRYASAADFARDLRAVVAGRTPQLVAGVVPVAAAAGAGALAGEDPEATTVLSPMDQPTEALTAQQSGTGRRAAVGAGVGAMAGAGVAGAYGDPATGAVSPQPEAPLEPEEERRKPIGLIVLVIIAILAALGASLFFFGPFGSDDPETVAVPSIVGLTQDEADAELKQAGLTPTYTEEASTEVEDGTVISSDPDEGENVDAGTTVTVVVSSGPADVAVPDVTGKSREEAEKALEEEGLVPSYQGEEDVVDAEKGDVTRTDPEAGVDAESGQEVKFWVATGKVPVPNVLNLQQDEATQEIEDAGLQVEVVEDPDSDKDPGTVTAQNPVAGGASVDAGSTVTITVAAEEGPVEIPNVKGSPEADARQRLLDAGFGVEKKTEASDSVDEGLVIRTEPGAGDTAEKGSDVTIVVSSGPEETTPPPTEEPTTTPEPTQTTPEPTTTTTPTGNGNGNGKGNGAGRGNGGG